jgi:alkyl sulfatase BDS1-like metallo-beta-lactamase superfamily hydrolase
MKRIAVLAFLLLLPGLASAQTVDELIVKGQRQVQAGNLPAAYATFKKAIDMEPRHHVALNAAAQVASFLNYHDESVFYYISYLYVQGEYLSGTEEIKKAMDKQMRAMYKPATLNVTVDPLEAEILVNGLAMGRGTLELPASSEKTYEISVEVTDYVPYKKTFSVSQSEEKTVNIRLEKIIYKGKVAIKILPSSDGVEVFSDTKKLGVGLAEVSLTEGKHLLCFRKAGFDRWWRYVTVPRNETFQLDLMLREQSRPDESCEVWPDLD